MTTSATGYLDGKYVLQGPRHYRHVFRGSLRLYRACWRQYQHLRLTGAFDDPGGDDDVLNALDQIAAEKVNNPRSVFYMYGLNGKGEV